MERISVDSKVDFGKPCVAGTRITVQDVLELIDEDLPFSQIIRDYYPDLTVADIHACIGMPSPWWEPETFVYGHRRPEWRWKL